VKNGKQTAKENKIWQRCAEKVNTVPIIVTYI
jgi:hypothetical protein